NVTNITVYKNVTVNRAVVGVPADRFGHHDVRPAHLAQAELTQLKPVHGALEVKPVAASVMPAGGHGLKPPAALQERTLVAPRAPNDVAPALRAQGLTPTERRAAPRLVPAPNRAIPAPGTAGPGPQGREPRRGAAEGPTPPPHGVWKDTTPSQPGAS